MSLSLSGAFLKERRKQLGFSVKYVIQQLQGMGINISDKTLYGWENGHRQPDADTFLRLCKIYDISTLEFEAIKRISGVLGATPDYILGLTNSPDTRIATQVDFDHFGEKESPEGWGYSEDEKDMLEKFKRLPLDDRNLIKMIVDYCFDRFIKRESEQHIVNHIGGQSGGNKKPPRK